MRVGGCSGSELISQVSISEIRRRNLDRTDIANERSEATKSCKSRRTRESEHQTAAVVRLSHANLMSYANLTLISTWIASKINNFCSVEARLIKLFRLSCIGKFRNLPPLLMIAHVLRAFNVFA